MYYLITEQLVHLAEEAGEDHEKALTALDFLDLASLLGKHFVCAENSSLFDRIIKLKPHAKCFRELRNNFSFIYSIGSTYHWHAEFLPGNTPSRIDEELETVFISLSELSRFEIYRETQLLGENLSDVRFYEIVLKFYKVVHGVEKTRSCFHPLLGGGHTTALVYRYECDNPTSFILCLADSDFKYCGAALGDTAKEIQKVYGYKTQPPFNGYYYFIERAREVENLIPLSIYKEYAKRPQTGASNRVDKISDLFTVAPALAPFFDMKDGVSLYTLLNHDSLDPILNEIKKIIPNIEKRVEDDSSQLEASKPGIKGESRKEEMKKIHYIDGLGSRILENILSCFDQDSILEGMIQNSNTFQTNEYERIGQLVYDWTASTDRKRI